MLLRASFHIIFFLFSLNIQAQIIEVGVFTFKNVKMAMLISQNGGYTIYGDGIRISELYQFEGIRAEYIEGKIAIRSLDNDFGSYNEVELRALTNASSINIKGLRPKTKEQEYNNHIKIHSYEGALQMINLVNIENYVAGVVEAETGKDRPFEFYKVQSIISRTYALANFRRHEEEGFQLCDEVHCQVYHGKSKYEDLIPQAVMSSKGIVIVDSDIELITAAFSSNCGGKTRNVEDVWSKEVSYLRTRVDSFCLDGNHAEWTKTIGVEKWNSYNKKEDRPPLKAQNTNGSIVMDDSFSEFLYEKEDLNGIRRYFNLNSTRFVMERKGESIVFTGRGFGHGVGLCQEGAISMGEKGYVYKDILESYYTGIHLIQLSSLNFFQSE